MPHAVLNRSTVRPERRSPATRGSRAVLLALAACASLVLSLTAVSAAHAYGPSKKYVTILNGQFTFIPLKHKAMITRSKSGYIYRAGQQDSRLEITRVKRGLRFHDAGTRRWRSLAKSCRRAHARVGVAAVCSVPGRTSHTNPLLLQIWPRLGDDFVDGSSLSASFDMSVLGDAGNDVARLGAGDDFFNGAFGRDRVRGGAGSDWLRTGDHADVLHGGRGNDRVVGVGGNDVVKGGSGNDRVEGGAGRDRVYSGRGRDRLSCGGGRDVATIQKGDATSRCERILRR